MGGRERGGGRGRKGEGKGKGEGDRLRGGTIDVRG